MFQTGLVSVSFRKESPETIIDAVSGAGLDCIEWGGDIHVPAGDLKRADHIGRLTREAGLRSAAYGSYYRIGCSADPEKDFKTVAETACALGAPVIRIWAGSKGSADTPSETRSSMIQEACMLSGIADQYGVDIALECHNGTLTDDWKSAVDLIHAVNHPRFRMYWQPNQLRDKTYNRRAAAEIAPFTVNIHVFHWDADHRYPLSDGTSVWQSYLEPFRTAPNDCGLLLEFIHDNNLETLNDTAATLRSWV